jgi:hypothetical protein
MLTQKEIDILFFSGLILLPQTTPLPPQTT